MIALSRNVYSKFCVLKTAYRFSENAFFKIDLDEKDYLVQFKAREGKNFSEADFMDELNLQCMREEIAARTSDIRKLILARAFASTLISANAEEKSDSFKGDEATILKDWFESNA